MCVCVEKKRGGGGYPTKKVFKELLRFGISRCLKRYEGLTSNEMNEREKERWRKKDRDRQLREPGTGRQADWQTGVKS